jgi:hypothetical protein
MMFAAMGQRGVVRRSGEKIQKKALWKEEERLQKTGKAGRVLRRWFWRWVDLTFFKLAPPRRQLECPIER